MGRTLRTGRWSSLATTDGAISAGMNCAAQEVPHRADGAPGAAVYEQGQGQRADRPRELVERVRGEEPTVGGKSQYGSHAREVSTTGTLASSSTWTMRPYAVRGLRKSYAEFEAVRGIDFEVAPRRGVRAARSERGRQDDHGRDPRGLPGAQRRRGQRARASTRRPAARAARSASASCSRPPASTATSACARRSPTSAGFTRTRATSTR